MFRSTETQCSPQYSPLIILYVPPARITATHIGANKSRKWRLETSREWFAPLLYTYHFSRLSSRTTGTIASSRSVSTPISKLPKWSFFWHLQRNGDEIRTPTRGNIPNGQVFTSAFTARPFRRAVQLNLFLGVEPPRSPSRVVLSASKRQARCFAHNSLTRRATFQLFTRDCMDATCVSRNATFHVPKLRCRVCICSVVAVL